MNEVVNYTDTHVHFDETAEASAALVARALAAGVTRMVAVGGSPSLNAAARAAAQAFPTHIRLALGFDRDHAGQRDTDLDLPDDGSLCAIGETGLDYHLNPAPAQIAAQQQLFAAMLRLAATHHLPAVIHTRAADADTLRVVDEAGAPDLAAAGRLGVVHCFTGDRTFARALLDRGLYISFSGIVTFRNAATLRDAARDVPDDRLLIETDSPFLAPMPHRGKRNEPAFVTHVAACLAALRGTTPAALAEQTSCNAARLFGPWPDVRCPDSGR